MKKCLLLLLFASPLLAGAITLTDTPKVAKPAMSKKPVMLKSPVAAQSAPVTKQNVVTNAYSHPLSFQLEGGTQGAGLDFRYGIVPQLSLRLGGSFVPSYTGNNLVDLPGFASTNQITLSYYNIHLLADFVPFKGFRSLRLVGGAGYLGKADGGFNVVPTGSYTYNGITVTGNDIGTLNMAVSWKGVAPYFGIGLFRSFPHHLFNFNLDLGTYYLTAPKTTIIGTGLLADNYQLEPQFDQNLKDYRWLPVLQLNFNFKLK